MNIENHDTKFFIDRTKMVAYINSLDEDSLELASFYRDMTAPNKFVVGFNAKFPPNGETIIFKDGEILERKNYVKTLL